MSEYNLFRELLATRGCRLENNLVKKLNPRVTYLGLIDNPRVPTSAKAKQMGHKRLWWVRLKGGKLSALPVGGSEGVSFSPKPNSLVLLTSVKGLSYFEPLLDPTSLEALKRQIKKETYTARLSGALGQVEVALHGAQRLFEQVDQTYPPVGSEHTQFTQEYTADPLNTAGTPIRRNDDDYCSMGCSPTPVTNLTYLTQETITAVTDHNKETKMKNTIDKAKDRNVSAVKSTAEASAGRALNAAVANKVLPLLPEPVRLYMDSPIGRVILANAAATLLDMYADSPKSRIASRAMVNAAYGNIANTFDIESLVEEFLSIDALDRLVDTAAE